MDENQRWPDQLVQKLSDRGITLELLLNPSVTGYTTLDVIERELPLLVDKTPDIITLQIGVNDFFRGVTLEEFSLRYTRLIREIRQKYPNSRLILVNIPDYGKTPYGSQTGDPMNIYRGILLYNARIRNIAEEYHLPIVDIFDLSLLVVEDPSLISSD